MKTGIQRRRKLEGQGKERGDYPLEKTQCFAKRNQGDTIPLGNGVSLGALKMKKKGR